MREMIRNDETKEPSPDFKAKVAREVIRKEITMVELPKKFGLHSTQIGTWKRAAHVFALFHLLGLRLAPRLKDFPNQKLACFGKARHKHIAACKYAHGRDFMGLQRARCSRTTG